MLLVLALAGDVLLTLPDQWPVLTPKFNDTGAWFAILLGAFIAFYAFIGFEDMVNMAEEVKSPETNVPKAIISALVISAVLYLLIALVAVLTLPLPELQSSQAPMKDILSQHSSEAAVVITLISLVAVINGAMVQIIMGAECFMVWDVKGWRLRGWQGCINAYRRLF
ncbi:MAG: amino acid transporter [Pseudohongiellaceae bacterium]